LTAKNQRDALLQTIEQKAHLHDRFEKMQRIDPDGGGGHFSLVLSARDRHSKKDVALKFFDPMKRADAYRWECFKREAELLPRFDGKPDILQCLCPMTEFAEGFAHPVTGLVFNVDFAYYAVELAEYDVNAAIITKRWSVDKRLKYFRAMCRAVQRIHQESMAHRDLKPGNFLIMADGELRLSDFGAARIISGSGILPSYTFPPGDLGYVSPEMVAALHDVDPRFAFLGDIYALGAILFELFSGSKLNLHVMDRGTLASLNTAMNAVPAAQRVETYNGFVSSFAAARPLPSLGLYGTDAPACIIDLLDRLYMALSALDYRDRLKHFERIFAQINRCEFVVRHEAAYIRWREQKRLRRAKSIGKV
jgi:serine/threonine protein kinase